MESHETLHAVSEINKNLQSILAVLKEMNDNNASKEAKDVFVNECIAEVIKNSDPDDFVTAVADMNKPKKQPKQTKETN